MTTPDELRQRLYNEGWTEDYVDGYFAGRKAGLEEAANVADEMETHAGGWGNKITTASYSGRVQDAIRKLSEGEK